MIDAADGIFWDWFFDGRDVTDGSGPAAIVGCFDTAGTGDDQGRVSFETTDLDGVDVITGDGVD